MVAMKPGRRLRHTVGLLRDVFGYAWAYRAWWLVPFVVVLLLLGVLVVAGTKALVMVYTLF
jgi:hypothetical protein